MIFEKDGYVLRPARAENAEAYYARNYCPLDPEAARMTGCKPCFSHDEVVDFFHRCLSDDSRRFFLLISPGGNIVGENVIHEIDPDTRSANYRVALFHPEDRGHGLGRWMARAAQEVAFGQLGLHRLELQVFSFNPRAERAYLAAGFRREGVRRDAVRDGDGFADEILMAVLEEEWRAENAGSRIHSGCAAVSE